MADDSFDLTRRRVLGSLGAAGVGAAAAGAGTTALFTDEENSTGNAITAGELDLQIGWTETYNGELQEEKDLHDNPGPIFELDDVKPCDYGEATISLHVYENPAWVHLGGDITNYENGINDPESEVDDSPDEGELGDAIFARVWYDDGDNVYDPGTEPQIAAGSLDEVMEELSQGVLLDGEVETGGNGETTCERLGKYDATPQKGDTYDGSGEKEDGFDAGTIDIVGVHKEDGEVVGIDWESTVDLCSVVVAGGSENGGSKTVETAYDCADSGTALAPENEKNRNRRWYEISYVTFYYCNGDGDTGKQCFENSTTKHVGFEWELPCNVGNEVQTDSVEFDLKFHAQQCRHVDDPENPFA